MKTFNVHEAKTHLSSILAKVAGGDEVTIARNGIPVAKLVPIPLQEPRKPGRFLNQFTFQEDPLVPLSESELEDWEEGHPDDPLLK